MENCALCKIGTRCLSCSLGFYLKYDSTGCVSVCGEGNYVRRDSEIL